MAHGTNPARRRHRRRFDYLAAGIVRRGDLLTFEDLHEIRTDSDGMVRIDRGAERAGANLACPGTHCAHLTAMRNASASPFRRTNRRRLARARWPVVAHGLAEWRTAWRDSLGRVASSIGRSTPKGRFRQGLAGISAAVVTTGPRCAPYADTGPKDRRTARERPPWRSTAKRRRIEAAGAVASR